MRRAQLAAPALGALALVLSLSACTGPTPGVRLATVSRGTIVETVHAPATVTARAVATLTAPAEGTLTALPAPPGTLVRVGQVVAVIDSPAARARLADARDALAATAGSDRASGTADLAALSGRTDSAAAASFAAARRAASEVADPRLRAAMLAQVDAAAHGYEQAAAAAQAAVERVQRGLAGLSTALDALAAAQRAQALSAYRLAKAAVDALVLRAPIGGVVQAASGAATGGGSPADPPGPAASAGPGGATPAAGARAGPGVDPVIPLGGHVGAGADVVTIVDISRLGLLAEVDETDVPLVDAGATGSVELEAMPGARYDVSVDAVDVLPTGPAGGGVSYRAQLNLAAGRYPDGRAAPAPRPGMSGVARLAVRRAQDAVVVPAAAVFIDGGRDAVWLVRAGRAERRFVHTGVSGADQVQILDGVVPGDRVVVAGLDKVRSGQRLP